MCNDINTITHLLPGILVKERIHLSTFKPSMCANKIKLDAQSECAQVCTCLNDTISLTRHFLTLFPRIYLDRHTQRRVSESVWLHT